MPLLEDMLVTESFLSALIDGYSQERSENDTSFFRDYERLSIIGTDGIAREKKKATKYSDNSNNKEDANIFVSAEDTRRAITAVSHLLVERIEKHVMTVAKIRDDILRQQKHVFPHQNDEEFNCNKEDGKAKPDTATASAPSTNQHSYLFLDTYDKL